MKSEEESNLKLDIKNIALKAPKKSKNKTNESFWNIFWINVPKRECIHDIRKEYSQVMENMTSN